MKIPERPPRKALLCVPGGIGAMAAFAHIAPRGRSGIFVSSAGREAYLRTDFPYGCSQYKLRVLTMFPFGRVCSRDHSRCRDTDHGPRPAMCRVTCC